MQSNSINKLELLSPAKNGQYGIEAIRHGADAIYIGAPAFGARAAASVSLEEIKATCDYAHLFGARVYVALNTILYPEEVSKAIDLAHKLYEIGADALIIQDLALLGEEMPPIPLHASTQMDNVSSNKISFWASQGIEQVVVARELSPRRIAQLHNSVPNLRLEAFVHGALCVSYSGRCYAAAAFHGRSANRGTCSQICRLPYDLIDAKGHILSKGRHLLSLKDLNRSSVLDELIDAGIRSFKIEGRLKDLAYVKTVTAHYHQLLTRYIASHPEMSRTSEGDVELRFAPSLDKSFSRGFTTFTHRGRANDDVASPLTPKAIGEEIGTVDHVKGKEIILKKEKPVKLANGDGFTFFHPKTQALTGFRINTATGTTLTVPRPIPGLIKGVTLYRNHDSDYEDLMGKKTSERTLDVDFSLTYESNILALTAHSRGVYHTVEKGILLDQSQKGKTKEAVQEVVEKLGDSVFRLRNLTLSSEVIKYFIPKSLLTQLRRETIDGLEELLRINHLDQRQKRDTSRLITKEVPFFKKEVTQEDNILNPQASEFVRQHGATVRDLAFEKSPRPTTPLMTTVHCIRYSMEMCPILQHYDERKLNDPWILQCVDPSNRHVRMRIEFDCPSCQMQLYSSEE